MEPGTRFEGNPFTGEGTLYTASGEQYTGMLSDFFGGRFDIRSGNLIDTQHITSSGAITTVSLGRIGQQGAFSVSELEGGRSMFTSQTLAAQANAPKALGEQRTVRGQQSVNLPDGSVQVVDFGPVFVNQLGRQTVAVASVDGGTNLLQLKKQYGSTAELQADIGSVASGADPTAFRLATPEETLRNSIAWGLFRSNPNIIGSINEQLIAQGEAPLSETDDIVDYLVGTIDLGALTVESSYVF